MNKRLRSVMTLVFTIVLLFLVFRKVGLQELLATLRNANPLWLMISLALTPFNIYTGVIKWRLLLKAEDIDIPTRRLYGYYLVGRFFNYFLPSNVGGDVVRGYVVGNYTQQGAKVMASVFVERFTGFVMLVVFSVIVSLGNLPFLLKTGLAPAVGLAVLLLVGVLWLILDTRPLDLFARVVPPFPFAIKTIEKLRKFHSSINAYRSHPKTLALTLVWSMIFMISAILNVYSSAMTFFQPVDLAGISVITPLILCVAMIPITINGLGIQEWAYVILFSWVGLPASLGLSTILLIRGKDVLVAMIGGLLYPVLTLKGSPLPLGEGGLPQGEGGQGNRSRMGAETKDLNQGGLLR